MFNLPSEISQHGQEDVLTKYDCMHSSIQSATIPMSYTCIPRMVYAREPRTITGSAISLAVAFYPDATPSRWRAI